MKSGWVDREAALFVEDGAKSGIDRDLALRVYTTRLLGRVRLLRRGGGRCRLFRCHDTAAGAGGRLAHGRTPARRLLFLERRRRGGRSPFRIHRFRNRLRSGRCRLGIEVREVPNNPFGFSVRHSRRR